MTNPVTPIPKSQDCEHEWIDAGDKPGLNSGDQLCLRCLDIKRATEAQSWEEEVERQADYDGSLVHGCYECGRTINPEGVKDFIRPLLAEQKAKILERVDWWRHTKEMQSTMYNRTMGDGVRRIIEES